MERETGAVGLNAATGEFEDLIKAGIIDPVMVTRSALENAASVAAMVLTTEVLISDKPTELRRARSRSFPAAASTPASRGGVLQM